MKMPRLKQPAVGKGGGVFIALDQCQVGEVLPEKLLFSKKILRLLGTWPCYSDPPREMGTLGTPWPML